MPVVPFANVAQGSAHCTIFNTEEFASLYEDLGAKMETFLNSAVNIPILQVILSYHCFPKPFNDDV